MCGQVTPSNAMLDAEYWSATAAGGDSMAGFSNSARGLCGVWCDVSRILCVMWCVVLWILWCVVWCIMLTPVPWWPAPPPPPGADNTQCVIVVQVNTLNTVRTGVLVWCLHRSPCCAGGRVPTLWWHSTFYKYPHLSPGRGRWGDNEEIGLEKMFLFMNGCKNVKISQIVSAFTFPSPNICTINGKVQILPTWNFAGHVNTRYWYSHSAAPMPPTSCFLPLGPGECNDKCRLQARPSLAGFLCSLLSTLSHKWPILGSSWL